MIASVSPAADWELSEGAMHYAREADAQIGLAFILEYERALALAHHRRKPAYWRART